MDAAMPVPSERKGKEAWRDERQSMLPQTLCPETASSCKADTPRPRRFRPDILFLQAKGFKAPTSKGAQVARHGHKSRVSSEVNREHRGKALEINRLELF